MFYGTLMCKPISILKTTSVNWQMNEYDTYPFCVWSTVAEAAACKVN